MEDKKTKTKLRTTKEKVELLAHSIIAACEVIRELIDEHPQDIDPHNIVSRSASSSQFHAEVILIEALGLRKPGKEVG